MLKARQPPSHRQATTVLSRIGAGEGAREHLDRRVLLPEASVPGWASRLHRRRVLRAPAVALRATKQFKARRSRRGRLPRSATRSKRPFFPPRPQTHTPSSPPTRSSGAPTIPPLLLPPTLAPSPGSLSLVLIAKHATAHERAQQVRREGGDLPALARCRQRLGGRQSSHVLRIDAPPRVWP